MKKIDIEQIWQYKELHNYIKQHHSDPEFDIKGVYLTNPKHKEDIKTNILQNIWPAIVKGVSTSDFWLKTLQEGYPETAIEDEQHIYPAQSLTFLLEDPNRSLDMGGSASWFCRGKITCSVMDYMVSFDFYIYFPTDFSLNKITRLLKNQMFAGMPPNLSYEKSPFNDEIYCVSFSKGEGAGWGLHSHEEAANIICEKIKDNIAIVKALYELEEDYKNTKLFNTLESALVKAYKSY